MSPILSVIIPTLGHSSSLSLLLQSIGQQNFDFSQLEVILILNGADFRVKNEIEKQFEGLPYSTRLISLNEKSASRARNEGLAVARGEILFFLDDDCEVHVKNTFKYHVDQHMQNPQMFALGGGYLLPLNSGFFDEIYNLIQMSWFVRGQKQSKEALKDTQYLLGGHFSVKSSMVRQNHIDFDNSIAYGGSESAFFKKAALLGLSMKATSIEVTHHTQETMLSVMKKVIKQGRGQALINQKLAHTEQHDTGELQVERVDPVFKIKLWLTFYNYSFWYGYYSAIGKRSRLIGKISSDFFKFLNKKRYDLLDHLNRKNQ